MGQTPWNGPSLPRQLALEDVVQPEQGGLPVALDGADGDAQQLGRLGLAQSAVWKCSSAMLAPPAGLGS
jgi:hypothetical protein